MSFDRDNSERLRSFSRRAFVVGALQAGFLCVLGGRLAWLQVAQGTKYKTMSDKNRINIKMLAPTRGPIVDRFGVPLAENGQNFRVLLVPEQTDNIEAALTSLQKLINLSQHDIQKVIKQAEKSAKFAPLEVKDNLEWEEVARIEVNLPDLPGLSIDVGDIRHYPMGKATAHLIGYVGAVSKSELTGDPVLSLPGFKVGKTGLEKYFDTALRGTAGAAEVEVNVVGREVRELGRNPGQPGARLTLTIDAELQNQIQRRLSETRSASAVIMDAKTGAVYALGSTPAFDPNDFSRGLSPEMWEELQADPAFPMNNKAIAGLYPPGSTFKMVTALAGLHEGVITRNTTAFCPGHYDFGDSRFHCWKPGGHGWVDVVGALQHSCDVFFYKMATDLGIDRLAEYSRMLGLGEELGIELPEERPGLVPTQAWKRGHYGESWQPGETIVASIGQGYIQTTPLQLAVMTARMVNGGYAVKPWVTAAIDTQMTHTQDWPKMNLKREYLDLVMQGMDHVVNSQRGTAYAARIEDPALRMAGKTGTAQVRRITKQERLEGVKNSDLPWRFQHHALFVGYAPVDNPRYVCSVVVEHGGGGSTAAAPVARDLLLMAQTRDPAAKMVLPEGVVPPGSAIHPPRRKPKKLSTEG
jgi:penicillin-binding protein 2